MPRRRNKKNGKIDILIPTLDEKKIRPKLMKVLRHASWVNDVIIETSKPLSRARVNGIKKCKTEWIAMFDDDVEIPENWFEKLWILALQKGVVAVSSPYLTINYDYVIMDFISRRFRSLDKRFTPTIGNVLFKRSAMIGYNPPPLFFCEDELFYRYIVKRGKWVHSKFIGAKHFYKEKDSLLSGVAQRILKFEPFYKMLMRVTTRFFTAVLASFYTHSLKTIYHFWRINVRILTGWIMGKRRALKKES
nr:glycosyltransferase [Candidatus Freyarchaeota archaeon]